jgi:hypothetical protein
MNEVSTNTNNRIASRPEPAEVEADQGQMQEADVRLPTIDHVAINELRVSDGGKLVVPREDLGDAMVGIRSSRRASGSRFRLNESSHFWKHSQTGGEESLVSGAHQASTVSCAGSLNS